MEPTGVQLATIFSGPDLLLILLVAVLLFGGRKVGDLGKGLGEGIRNFKSALKGEDEKDARVEKVEEKKQA